MDAGLVDECAGIDLPELDAGSDGLGSDDGQGDEDDPDDEELVDGDTCPELLVCLQYEVDRYKDQVKKHMNSGDAVDSLVCRFCPYRKFGERRKLQTLHCRGGGA